MIGQERQMLCYSTANAVAKHRMEAFNCCIAASAVNSEATQTELYPLPSAMHLAVTRQ